MNAKIKIPTRLSEITLRNYREVERIHKSKMDDTDKVINTVSCLCNLSTSDTKSIQWDEVIGIYNRLIGVMNQEAFFTNRFKINGVEYGFIPNLDKMSIGEYSDIDTFMSQDDNELKIMSVLYRPITVISNGLYEIEDYTGDENYDTMMDAPMNAVESGKVFFYSLGSELLEAIPHYLDKALNNRQISEQDLARQTRSQRGGDGTLAYLHLLMDNLTDLIKPPQRTYIKPLLF